MPSLSARGNRSAPGRSLRLVLAAALAAWAALLTTAAVAPAAELSHPAWAVSGLHGHAIVLDGRAVVRGSTGINLARGMTLTAWVRPTGRLGRSRIFARKGRSPFALQVRGNRLQAFVTARGRRTVATAPVVLRRHAWTYVAMTYDRRFLRVYSGLRHSARRRATRVSDTPARPILIGAASGRATGLRGRIDGVRIYGRALTRRELAAASKTAVGAPAPTLIPPSVAALVAEPPIPLPPLPPLPPIVTPTPTPTSTPTPTPTSTPTPTPTSTPTPTPTSTPTPIPTSTPTPTPTATPSPTPIPDTTAPTAPGALRATSTGETSITLAWNASSDNVRVTGYRVDRNGTTVADTTSTQQTVSALTCGTAYTLGVRAFDAAGNFSGRSTLAVTTADCPAPDPTTANLWVDNSGGSCTRQATGAAYADASACGSFQAAWNAAQPGDDVRIKSGSYGAQTIPVRSVMSKATEDVTFAPASGATVTLTDDLTILGSHFRLRGGTAPYDVKMNAGTVLVVDPIGDYTSGADQTHDVLIENVDGANFSIGPVKDDVTIKGGDWGPSVSCSGGTENEITASGSFPGVSPNGVTLDGVYIHDQNTSNAVSCHTGGLIVQGGTNIAIRNSRFESNAIYDILVDDPTNGTFPTHDWVLENNWFGSPVRPAGSGDSCPSGYGKVCIGQGDIQIKWHGVNPTNWLIRFNSFGNGIAPNWGGDAGSTWTNFRIIGNTGGMLSDDSPRDYHVCEIMRAGVTVKYNAWTPFDNLDGLAHGPTCGDATNKASAASDYDVTKLPYVNPQPGSADYRLKAGTAAQDLVTPTSADYSLDTDLDGQRRPMGAARDAGSDEHG